jgi:RNA polymerase sigma factor (TIGR02999 family)
MPIRDHKPPVQDEPMKQQLQDQNPEIAALLPAVYAELRRIASANMARMPMGSTLQPTALVHEAWLRLGGSENASWQSRAHFLAAAAEAMRHILIDRARQRSAMRHGGKQQRVDIEHIDIPIDTEDDERLLAISKAVDKLTAEHPQIAELVKLRCFVGLETSEAAKVLGIPRATAYRRWQFARTWLYKELRG